MMEMTYETSLSASTIQICDAKFESADEKFKALVAASKREGFKLSDGISHYTGPFDLSEYEQELFGIDVDKIHGVRWAYERYEHLIGKVDYCFGDHVEQERKDHAEYFREERYWSFDDAFCFMTWACNQDGVTSLAWLCKILAAEVRGGLYTSVDQGKG